MNVESGGVPSKNKTSTASGTMQVLNSTAKNPGVDGVTPAKDYSDEEKDRVGRELVAAYSKMYPDDPERVALAYHTGKATGDRWDGSIEGLKAAVKSIPSEEAQEYIDKFLSPFNMSMQTAPPGEEGGLGSEPSGARPDLLSDLIPDYEYLPSVPTDLAPTSKRPPTSQGPMITYPVSPPKSGPDVRLPTEARRQPLPAPIPDVDPRKSGPDVRPPTTQAPMVTYPVQPVPAGPDLRLPDPDIPRQMPTPPPEKAEEPKPSPAPQPIPPDLSRPRPGPLSLEEKYADLVVGEEGDLGNWVIPNEEWDPLGRVGLGNMPSGQPQPIGEESDEFGEWVGLGNAPSGQRGLIRQLLDTWIDTPGSAPSMVKGVHELLTKFGTPVMEFLFGKNTMTEAENMAQHKLNADRLAEGGGNVPQSALIRAFLDNPTFANIPQIDSVAALQALRNATGGLQGVVDERGFTGQGYAQAGRQELSDIFDAFQPGQDFGSLLNELIGQTAGSTALFNKDIELRGQGTEAVGAAFPGDSTYFDPKAFNAVANNILEGRFASATEQISNAEARGNLSSLGASRGVGSLSDQRTGAETRLGEIGSGLRGGQEREVGAIGERALTGATGFKLGDELFDVTPFETERDTLIAEREGSLGEDFRSQLGGEQLFDTGLALRTAGQGQTTAGGNLLNIFADRELGALAGARRRGLGSAGTGAF
jgi:hypothetical protein